MISKDRAALPRRFGWSLPALALALGAVAVAIGLLVQLPSENLLTQTFIYWYAAAAMTFGMRPSPVSDGDTSDDDAAAQMIDAGDLGLSPVG